MCKSVDILFTNSDEARVHPTHLLRHLEMCPSLELFNIISKLEHTWKLGDGNAKLATPSNQLVIIIIILCHCHHKLSTLATLTCFLPSFLCAESIGLV
jgi:hypothetical protein